MAYKKCLICGETIKDEQGVSYKGRFVHQHCFNIAMKTLQKDKKEKLEEKVNNVSTKKLKKPKAELKDASTEEEYQDKKTYYEYLRELTGEEQLSAKVYVLTDNCIKNYNFTFKGMYLTLIYLNEIIGKELNGDIVGIIPYYYDEAKQYNMSVELISKNNDSVSIMKMYKEKVIKIEPKHKKVHQIDITQIGGK